MNSRGHFLVINGSQIWIPEPIEPLLSFIVFGDPIGQGRVSFMGKGRSIHSNSARLKPWRTRILEAASHQIEVRGLNAQFPLTNPVCIDRYYTMPYPEVARKEGRLYPIVKSASNPDIDHLDRALFDALSPKKPGVWPVLLDDGLIIGGQHWKTYPSDSPAPHPHALARPGVLVQIRLVEGTADGDG